LSAIFPLLWEYMGYNGLSTYNCQYTIYGPF